MCNAAVVRSERITQSQRRRVGALVVATALVAAACGGDGSDEVASTTVGAAPTTTSAAPATTTAPDATTTTGAPTTAVPGPMAWQQVDAGAVAPSPRSGAVLAVAPDGTLWLHGGHVDRVPLGDLWRFDGTAWEEVVAEGGPTPRSEHAAVWDDERDRLVVALGEGDGGEVFDDVWAFDPATTTWTELASGGPAGRYGTCAVIDGQGRMVITHGFSSVQRFDDTWAFDLAAESWTDITPAEGPRPVNRCLHACGYDPASDEIVLFGGRSDETPYLGDTWRLGATGWQELAVAGPSARARSRGAFTDAFLVVGGEGEGRALVDDAWLFADGAWSSVATGAPTDRQAPAVAERDGVVWLVGGLGDAGPVSDLWRWG